MFDGMTQRLASALSRRSLVGGSVGASVLAAVGLGQTALAKRKRQRIGTEACISSGKKCPSKKPRGKKGKKLSCDQCCEGRSVTVTNSKGKQVQKCGCVQTGSACTTETECCSNFCANGFCQIAPCAALGETCSPIGGAGLFCCANAPAGAVSTVYCDQVTPTSPGTCKVCATTGGACDPSHISLQCCLTDFCLPSGATTGSCTACKAAGAACDPSLLQPQCCGPTPCIPSGPTTG